MNNFDDAARLLAQPLGDLLLALPEQTKEEITELRVRRGRPLVVMLGSRTCFLTDGGKLINHCSARALSVTDAAFDALFAAVCALFRAYAHGYTGGGLCDRTQRQQGGYCSHGSGKKTVQ